jgi:hypothetical protein
VQAEFLHQKIQTKPLLKAKVRAPPVSVGARRYWSLVLPAEYATVEALLNRIGVP